MYWAQLCTSFLVTCLMPGLTPRPPLHLCWGEAWPEGLRHPDRASRSSMTNLTQASLMTSRRRKAVCTVHRAWPLFQRLHEGRIKKQATETVTRTWGWLSTRETSLEEVCGCNSLLNDCPMVPWFPVGFLSKEIPTLCLSHWLCSGEASYLHVGFSWPPSLLRASPTYPLPALMFWNHTFHEASVCDILFRLGFLKTQDQDTSHLSKQDSE